MSIYQRRIIDKFGRTDSGITAKINNLVKMRRKSAKSLGKSNRNSVRSSKFTYNDQEN